MCYTSGDDEATQDCKVGYDSNLKRVVQSLWNGCFMYSSGSYQVEGMKSHFIMRASNNIAFLTVLLSLRARSYIVLSLVFTV